MLTWSMLLARASAAPGASLLIAVPPGYSREQLGLLVGIANEAGVTLRGLVDLGLAACSGTRRLHTCCISTCSCTRRA